MKFKVGDLVRLDPIFEDSDHPYHVIATSMTMDGVFFDSFYRIQSDIDGSRFYCNENSLLKIINYTAVWRDFAKNRQ